jgi:hypothetical protein
LYGWIIFNSRIFYIRDRRTKKRFKEESLNLDVEIRELEGERDELMDQLYVYPLREYKEDFLPKYKMRYHTLVEPIAYYSEANQDKSCIFVLTI